MGFIFFSIGADTGYACQKILSENRPLVYIKDKDKKSQEWGLLSRVDYVLARLFLFYLIRSVEKATMNPAIIVNFDKQYQPVIKHIRTSVFTLEQNVPEALDFEGKDPDATHALVQDGDRYVGTGRLLGDGHIGRVAVLQEYRQRGFGKSIIAALIDAASQLGLARVFLGAQLHAVDFYKTLGFSEYGEVFVDAGIEHIHMERKIR